MYQQPGLYGTDQDSYRPDQPVSHRNRALVAAVAAVAAAAAAATAAAVYASSSSHTVSGTGSVLQQLPAMDRNGDSDDGSGGGSDVPWGTTGTATAAQQIGVVDINTVLGYQHASAAGTGMILSSTGEVLTNNHVVNGATSITVQVVTTGKTYRASVVGTDPSEDVAVLQLQNASGLQTAKIGSSAALRVGATVTGVGNAGGRGGTPSAATGSITALDQSLTATDESGQSAEQLTGMIETNAPIEAGDSGGPLYDSATRVIGMDTAASSGRFGTSAGFAIPIDRATSIASEIEAGHESTTIHIGYPGLLGVSAADSANPSGALVESALANGPAAKAGIDPGDVITAVGGTSVGSADALRTALAAYEPGQSVAVTWLDPTGARHRATITLIAGPAD